MPALEKTNLLAVQGLLPHGDNRDADACAQVLGCSIFLTPPEPICALWSIASKLSTEAEAPWQQHVRSREGWQLLEGQDAHGLAQIWRHRTLWQPNNNHLSVAEKGTSEKGISDLLSPQKPMSVQSVQSIKEPSAVCIGVSKSGQTAPGDTGNCFFG